jgi:hypothetical protein
LRLNKTLAEAMISSMAESGCTLGAMPIRAFDVLVAVVLYSIDVWQRKLFKMLDATPDMFPEPLIRATFAGRAAALHPLFSQILSLAEKLVRAGSGNAKRLGGALYAAAFDEFRDSHSHQDIFGFVMTHISSSSPEEVDVAISVLEFAVARAPLALQHFAAQLKGTVDHVDKLSLADVGRLYSVFAAACFTGQDVKLTDNEAASAPL